MGTGKARHVNRFQIQGVTIMEHCQIIEIIELWQKLLGDALDPLQVALWAEEGTGYAPLQITRQTGRSAEINPSS